MYSQQKEYVTAYSHDWVQTLPLKDNKLICADCKAETKIGNWDVSLCNPKLVPKSWMPNDASNLIEIHK